MRLLHLSDTHLFGDDTLHHGIVDTGAALERVLARADGIDDIDAVVLSGDLSDDTTTASYERVKAMVEPWAARHSAEVVYAMGNHDGRASFEAVLGARIGVTTVCGVRIVRLDSSVPGAGYGALDADQLKWLRAELAADQQPTVVVLHHPPTRAYGPLLQALELQRPHELLDVCAEAGVQAILGGHYHHPMVATEQSIAVIVAPGVANTSDACPPLGHERATVGSGFAVVDIPTLGAEPHGAAPEGAAPQGAARVTFVTAPSTDDGTQLFDLDPADVASIAQSTGA